jgi:hypothetical protein
MPGLTYTITNVANGSGIKFTTTATPAWAGDLSNNTSYTLQISAPSASSPLYHFTTGTCGNPTVPINEDDVELDDDLDEDVDDLG